MFERFIGIDWSGAKGPSLKGLQVAVCEPGESLPKLILSPQGKYWCRSRLVDWIIKETEQRRILVGVDFGFAYPFLDKSAYFPNDPESPESASALWQIVDSICRDIPDFYAGSFYKYPDAPFSEYLRYQTYRGRYFDGRRMRKTEEACKLLGTKPTCMFKCVGPDQVGSGSASGMRVLHFLASNYRNVIGIWPFENVSESASIMVEIFPRLFFTIAKQDYRKWNNNATVSAVLRYFKSVSLMGNVTKHSEDEIDAIISSAALRALSHLKDCWYPSNLDKETRRFEGWIFGSY